MVKRLTPLVVVCASALVAGCSTLPAKPGEAVAVTPTTPPAGVGAGTASAKASGACFDPAQAPAIGAPPLPACANDELLAYDALLVLAPHPDDESLGFGGLAATYRAQGKPVTEVVVTDGDAYCEACRLWKSSSVHGPTCTGIELSNLATPEVDSFAEVRRGESVAAATVLGLGAPTFLGYPDAGLAAAWRNREKGEMERPLRRTDFSHCTDCETCVGGYGEGVTTDFTAATLEETIRERLAVTSLRTLVATTHWLDGHGDHAALGSLVRELDAALPQPRAVAYAVIHAHTPKDTAHPDCWYPAPRALACPCAGEEGCATADATWVARLAKHRFHPDWPAGLPDDADYGEPRQLCLAPELWQGESATKLAAVRAYASQRGTAARHGAHPAGLSMIMDCNGYLGSFVRRTEAFVLESAEAK
ncbi:MAG TPA: PIG-L family deacetylase [Thermoanaerobaculia bacterium]|nr:PIG-L family deacetylase [Thermoanaerobaculia bacterium]